MSCTSFCVVITTAYTYSICVNKCRGRGLCSNIPSHVLLYMYICHYILPLTCLTIAIYNMIVFPKTLARSIRTDQHASHLPSRVCLHQPSAFHTEHVIHKGVLMFVHVTHFWPCCIIVNYHQLVNIVNVFADKCRVLCAHFLLWRSGRLLPWQLICNADLWRSAAQGQLMVEWRDRAQCVVTAIDCYCLPLQYCNGICVVCWLAIED